MPQFTGESDDDGQVVVSFSSQYAKELFEDLKYHDEQISLGNGGYAARAHDLSDDISY